MHPFRRILVYASPADEDQLALELGARLARSTGASLTLAGVVEPQSFSRPFRRAIDELDARCERERLEAAVADLRKEMEVRVEILRGTAWLELVRFVLRDGHDLVLKAADGMGRGSGLFFGSTALHLIRKCPCPVWVVGSEGASPRRVMAAVDPGEDEVRGATARRVLELAVALAGEEVHPVAAWNAPGETLYQSRMPPSKLEAYVRSAREEAERGLKRALAGLPIAAERVQLVKGDARRVLPALVEKEDFDLVVMGGLGRVGVAGFLIGETAETVIRSVRCSVLVVKPPGFRSPVERDA